MAQSKEILKEKRRKNAKVWYENNKEKKNSYAIKFRIEKPERVLFLTAKTRAKKRNIEFSLDQDDIVIPEFCPILGLKLEVSIGKGIQKNSPSLDRIDPNKGYVKGNVWVLSHLANRMKNSATIDELKLFSEWIDKNYD